MSSTRPPMLAGPMPRKTNRLSIGSCDQLTGVGVGVGVAEGVGVCTFGACGVGAGAGFCARLAAVPSASAQAKASSHTKPDTEVDLTFIRGGLPFKCFLGGWNATGPERQRRGR